MQAGLVLLASCSWLLGGYAAGEGALGRATTLLERMQRHNLKTWQFLVDGGHVHAIKSLPVWKKVEEMVYEAELEEGVHDLLGPVGGRLLGLLRGLVYETDISAAILQVDLLGVKSKAYIGSRDHIGSRAHDSYRPKS